MSLDGLQTKADLARFVQEVVKEPGAVPLRTTTGGLEGARVNSATLNTADLNLAGRVAEGDLAAPNTWLRLATAANRKVSFGVATITGTGTSTAVSASIPHGLGAAPIAVVATASAVAGTLTAGSLITTVSSIGGTDFTIRIRDYLGTAFSDNHDVYWVAIG